MKLEIGMYIRTPNGIAKIKSMYAEPNQYIVYTDNKDIVFEYYLNNKNKWVSDYVKKFSNNIIDLIEPMDLMYIDISPDDCGGIVVPRVAETLNELEEWKERISSGECILKGVLTKEQIVSNWYLDESRRNRKKDRRFRR